LLLFCFNTQVLSDKEKEFYLDIKYRNIE